MNIQPSSGLRGTVTIPGDKSISHRAVMFGAIAEGLTEITGFLEGADCLATIRCFRSLGIQIENKDSSILVHGKGLHGLTPPSAVLEVHNSGTTTRLLSGILSGQSFESVLSGDASLNTRPMGRIIDPLTQMHADITSINKDGCAPLRIRESKLSGFHYHSNIASAQVKSAILLAGLYACGETSVTEPTRSRDHTELMLRSFGADIQSLGSTASIRPGSRLLGQRIVVPGDISSAAYFIAAALIVPHSKLLIRNVGINPTRAGMLKVCRDMGGDITLLNEKSAGGEPVADLLVRTSNLRGTVIEGDLIPTLIDEIPVIAVMAANASGETVIRNAAELKVKETNRIGTVTQGLSAMGADITPTDDGMIIKNSSPLQGACIESHLDHRIAMAFTVAGLAAKGNTTILDSHCVDVSYPAFFESFRELS